MKISSIADKSAILTGRSADYRLEKIEQAKIEFSKKGWKVFVLPAEGLDYGKIFVDTFPVTSPAGMSKYDMSRTQLADYGLEWVHSFPSVLIIIPEVQKIVTPWESLSNKEKKRHPKENYPQFEFLERYLDKVAECAERKKGMLRILMTCEFPVTYEMVGNRQISPDYWNRVDKHGVPDKLTHPLSSLVEIFNA